MTTPDHDATPLHIEIVPAPRIEGDAPGQVRVAEIRVNGHRAPAPNQLVFVGTELREGEPILVTLQCFATIVTSEPTEEG